MGMSWLFIIPIIAILMASVHSFTKYPVTECPDCKGVNEAPMICIGGHGITPGSIDCETYWLCEKCNRVWVSFPGRQKLYLPETKDEKIYASRYLGKWKGTQK